MIRELLDFSPSLEISLLASGFEQSCWILGLGGRLGLGLESGIGEESEEGRWVVGLFCRALNIEVREIVFR